MGLPLLTLLLILFNIFSITGIKNQARPIAYIPAV